jgi:hypothetical protein
VAYGCIPAKNTSVTASVPEEPAASGKKPKGTAAESNAGKERNVTIVLPLISEFASGIAGQ